MQREEVVTVGTVAPEFALLDQAARPWALSEHLDAAAVLVFYRGDW
jgi:peroxiredoxin